jgi:hypothetical protein
MPFAHRRTLLLLALSACALAAAVPAGASASATLGSSLTFNGSGVSFSPCYPLCTLIPTGDVDNPVQSPISGVIVRWGTSPSDADTTTARLRVLHAVSTGPFIWVGDRTGPTEVFTIPSHTNIFFDLKPGLPISQDDYIGMDTNSASGDVTTLRPSTGSYHDFFQSPLADGAAGQAASGSTANEAVYLQATVEPDADGDGFGDETQDKCPGVSAPIDGCPPAATTTPIAHKKKCKKHRRLKKGKCVKKKRRR